MGEEQREEFVERLGGVLERAVGQSFSVGVEDVDVVVLRATVETDIQEDGEDGHAKRSFVGERSCCAV
jgi:hypothetical protein